MCFFRSRDADGGQAIVLVALMMTAMLAFVGLAIDAGIVYSEQRSQREATDAAAWGAAVVLYLSNPVDAAAQQAARDAGYADATRNGYTTGSGVTVDVTTPPTSGTWAGDPKYVQVTITRDVKTVILRTQGGAPTTRVTTRAVAGAAPISSAYAMILLKPTAGPCLSVIGAGGVVVPAGPDLGGGIQANCTGTSVALAGSGGIVDPLGVFTVGTVDYPAKVLPPNVLQQNQPVQRDPFAGFPKPPATPVVWAGPSAYSVPAAACNSQANALEPGVYVGGIINNLAPTCTVYLKTGVFVLKGGGFDQNASNPSIITNVTGGGTMLFNTHSNYGVSGSGSCGAVKADQGGAFRLKAMTAAQTPNYAGMALYQDAACTVAIVVASNGALDLEGTLYAPTALLSLQSQSSASIRAQVVVSTATIQSSGALTVIYRPSGSAQTTIPSIVE